MGESGLGGKDGAQRRAATSGWLAIVSVLFLLAGCAGSTSEPLTESSTQPTAEPTTAPTTERAPSPADEAETSDTTDAAEPEAAEPEAVEPTAEPTETPRQYLTPAEPVGDVVVLGEYGRNEVYLSPNGRYGYVQASDDNPTCFTPLLDSATACFDASSPRFDVEPRWDLAGERMAYGPNQDNDIRVVNAATGDTQRLAILSRVIERPGWLGSYLAAHDRDEGPMIVTSDGLAMQQPGSASTPLLAREDVLINAPPVATPLGDILIATDTTTLVAVSRKELRTFPFPDDIERATTNPNISALRPPLVPMQVVPDGRVLIADRLPHEMRATGNWSATSGAYLLDVGTGEYEAVFTDGRTDATAVVAVGLGAGTNQLLFLWSDDEAEEPIMRLGSAPLADLPIAPRQADVLYEADPGVVLSGTDLHTPLAWTASNQTAFRIDDMWVHVQLPPLPNEQQPSQQNQPSVEETKAEVALLDFMVANAPIASVAACMREEGAAEVDADLTRSLVLCGGALTLNGDVPEEVKLGVYEFTQLYDGSRPDLDSCMFDELRIAGWESFFYAAFRCNKDGLGTDIVGFWRELGLPQDDVACLEAAFADLTDEFVLELTQEIASSNTATEPFVSSAIVGESIGFLLATSCGLGPTG